MSVQNIDNSITQLTNQIGTMPQTLANVATIFAISITSLTSRMDTFQQWLNQHYDQELVEQIKATLVSMESLSQISIDILKRLEHALVPAAIATGIGIPAGAIGLIFLRVISSYLNYQNTKHALELQEKINYELKIKNALELEQLRISIVDMLANISIAEEKFGSNKLNDSVYVTLQREKTHYLNKLNTIRPIDLDVLQWIQELNHNDMTRYFAMGPQAQLIREIEIKRILDGVYFSAEHESNWGEIMLFATRESVREEVLTKERKSPHFRYDQVNYNLVLNSARDGRANGEHAINLYMNAIAEQFFLQGQSLIRLVQNYKSGNPNSEEFRRVVSCVPKLAFFLQDLLKGAEFQNPFEMNRQERSVYLGTLISHLNREFQTDKYPLSSEEYESIKDLAVYYYVMLLIPTPEFIDRADQDFDVNTQKAAFQNMQEVITMRAFLEFCFISSDKFHIVQNWNRQAINGVCDAGSVISNSVWHPLSTAGGFFSGVANVGSAITTPISTLTKATSSACKQPIRFITSGGLGFFEEDQGIFENTENIDNLLPYIKDEVGRANITITK